MKQKNIVKCMHIKLTNTTTQGSMTVITCVLYPESIKFKFKFILWERILKDDKAVKQKQY